MVKLLVSRKRGAVPDNQQTNKRTRASAQTEGPLGESTPTELTARLLELAISARARVLLRLLRLLLLHEHITRRRPCNPERLHLMPRLLLLLPSVARDGERSSEEDHGYWQADHQAQVASACTHSDSRQ
jgi:hypothetical protein